MNILNTLTALELAEKIRLRELTALDVAKHTLEQIASDPCNCFMSPSPESALAAAAAVDTQLESGICPSLLAGVPIAIDDTILMRQERCTAGSRMLDTFVSPFSATVVDKILSAGLVPVGRTNTDELGVSGSGSTCYQGPTLNPRHPETLSGGAAAAIASRLVPLALCCDSIGTPRKFASLSGTVFLKPTYGSVSRFGIVAYVSSAEQIGPAAATLNDAAALFNIIAGHDSKDGTSLPDHTPLTLIPRQDLRGMRVGVLPYWDTLNGMSAGSRSSSTERFDTLNTTINRLCELGADICECDLPQLDLAHLVLRIIAAAEGCTNFSRFDGVKFGHRPQTITSLEDIYVGSRSEGFGLEVKKTILLGSYVLAQQNYEKYYLQALKIRRLIQDQLTHLLQSFDCLLLPASSHKPYHPDRPNANTRLSFEDMRYTAPATLAGFPAAAAPAPVHPQHGANTPGIQLIAGIHGEQKLYDVLSVLSANPAPHL